MKLVTYAWGNAQRFGIAIEEQWIADVARCYRLAKNSFAAPLERLPADLLAFLQIGAAGWDALRLLDEWLAKEYGNLQEPEVIAASRVQLSAPLPRPVSMRDGYAFRQHVETARRNRGLPMIPEFDQFPVFYFTNHLAVQGPGEIWVQERHLERLDFELECAVVIGKEGKNIPAEKADEYIVGLMIMNDWSARALQMEEMKLNLGPAKGKDFATSLGPYLVTVDELEDRKIVTPQGVQYDLQMEAYLNGERISQGNLKDMSWTFAQILERVSYGVTIYPGEVIGSGTVGTGCLLELNGSKVFDPPRWLHAGDTVELRIERLGSLRNTVRRASN